MAHSRCEDMADSADTARRAGGPRRGGAVGHQEADSAHTVHVTQRTPPQKPRRLRNSSAASAGQCWEKGTVLPWPKPDDEGRKVTEEVADAQEGGARTSRNRLARAL